MSKKNFQILVMIVLALFIFFVPFSLFNESDSRGQRLFKSLLILSGAWLAHIFIYKPLEKRLCNDSEDKDAETNSTE